LYVRLLTSPVLGIGWHHQPFVEVIDKSSVDQIPSYGLPDLAGMRSFPSGKLGILSLQAYRKGHFTKPFVEKTKLGFTIIRWIAWGEYAGEFSKVKKIKENVGFDGSYCQTVLLSKPVPTLPNTDWSSRYGDY
jgi:hypothetical protein